MRIDLPVFTFRGLQRVERRFRQISHLKRTSQELLPHLHNELQELQEAIHTGSRREIMCEVADIFILASEVANAEGFSLSESVQGKLRRNNDKYNPRKLRRLQIDWGMTPQESMDFAKAQWDRQRDNSYYGKRA